MSTIPTDTDHDYLLPIALFDGETMLSGLDIDNFTFESYLGDTLDNTPTFAVAEVGATGKYVITSQYPQEGQWAIIFYIEYDGVEVYRSIYHLRVSNSVAQVSVQSHGESVGPVSTLNFVGEVVVEEDNGVASIRIETHNPTPDGGIDSSKVPAQVGGETGTLCFKSGTT